MDDDVFSDTDSSHHNNAEFDLADWGQYEADLAANGEEEIAVPQRNEHFFGEDEGRAELDDIQLEAVIEIEIEDSIPEQDQDGFEGDRRVQVIEEGIELVREVIEEMGDMAPELEVQQQLQEFIRLLQLPALAIQVLIGNLSQISRPNCQHYFCFYDEEILQMVVAL
ncbi:hypothetical protein BG000_003965 [Podila horticola]|nr:hypothetical protein BG000_003965 [Podila horticola]